MRGMVLTVAQFAPMIGISKVRMYHYVQKGHVVMEAGKINTDHPTNAAWVASRDAIPADSPFYKPPTPPPALGGTYTNRGRPRTVNSDTELFDPDAIDQLCATGNFAAVAKADIEKLYKYEAMQKIRAEREYKRGDLIDRKLVQTVFGRLYQLESNEVKTLGARVSAEICGLCGVEDAEAVLQVEKRIDDEVVKILGNVKRLFDDFLRGIGQA